MKKSIPASTKKRGRPKTTGPGIQVVVRFQPHLLSAVDRFIKDENGGHPSRPAAIRLILDDWLKSHGYLKTSESPGPPGARARKGKSR